MAKAAKDREEVINSTSLNTVCTVVWNAQWNALQKFQVVLEKNMFVELLMLERPH